MIPAAKSQKISGDRFISYRQYMSYVEKGMETKTVMETD